jgi:hypothetical protein
MNVVIYKLASGEIIKSVTCPEDMVPLQYDPETEDYLEHDRVNDALFYILDDQIVSRPEFQETISGTVISGLPVPTTVVTNGVTSVVSDGEADLTFEHSGTYIVQLFSFPFVEKTVEVTQP